MTYGASSPHRSQSEVKICRTLSVELTVATEDGASAAANNDYIEQQVKDEVKRIRKHTDFENIRVEG